VEPPLDKKILAGFNFPKNDLNRAMMQKSKSINVAQFGAKGDGIADDTAAFNKAIAATEKVANTELVVPGGLYKISQTLELPANITIRGLGLACFKGKKGNETLFRSKNARQVAFLNIGFYNAAFGADISTAANEQAAILFDHCTFSKLNEAAVRCLAGKGLAGETNRTKLRITDSVYGIQGRAMVTNADNALFNYNWLSLYGDNVKQGTLLNKGTMAIVDNIGVPSVKSPATWIENHNNVLVDNMRFGGEGKYKKNLIANNSATGKIYMRYSWLYCDCGSIVVCNQIPEIIALVNNLGVPVVKFHTMIDIRKSAKGKLEGHFFDNANIPPVNITDERK
jgi:hypothetical protein